MSTVFGIYGDEAGLLLYKYFDLHQIVAVLLMQGVIFAFQVNYVQALWFFALCSGACIVVVGKLDLSPEPEEAVARSRKLSFEKNQRRD